MGWKEDCIKEAKALTVEKRQEFLDCLMKEHLTLGQSYEKVGISFNAANGIMMIQMKEVTYLDPKAT